MLFIKVLRSRAEKIDSSLVKWTGYDPQDIPQLRPRAGDLIVSPEEGHVCLTVIPPSRTDGRCLAGVHLSDDGSLVHTRITGEEWLQVRLERLNS